jgi:hypothetical protein
MSFVPDLPFEKSQGDIIRSKDWNDAVHEIQRLDTAKVNRTNDSIPGPLTITGALNFGAQTRQMINLWSTEYAIGIQAGTTYFRTHKNFAWYRDGSHSDAELTAGTGGTVQMVINNGNVGIGTANPQSPLDVQGAIRAGNSDIYFTSTNHTHTGNGNAPGFAAIENDGNTYNALMILGRSVGLPIGRMVKLWDYLTVNGTLEVTGTAIKPGGGAWSAPSDQKLKKNIQSLRGALEKLLQLRGVTFEWKSPEQQGNQTGPQVGMVAQEVEEIFPEWVGQMPDGTKLLSIHGFEALVVEALRSIDARLKAMEENPA